MTVVGAPPEQVLSLPAGSLLAPFNLAGALGPADVHVALRLCRLAGEEDQSVALAVALAVRAPRYGHVLVDLSTVAQALAGLEDVGHPHSDEDLPWPPTEEWLQRVAASPLVNSDEAQPSPLRLEGARLYLDRYWREERYVATALLERCGGPQPVVDEGALEGGLAKIFTTGGQRGAPEQAEAAALVVRRRLGLVVGGPGTGKTTTIARALALLYGQSERSGTGPPLVALAAPTGKAAARMTEAVHREAANAALSPEARQWLLNLRASTVHRLLGRQPGSSARPRYDRFNQLPHDVVVVDETSMLSLSLMAALLQALRAEARLVLVGDPEQLASVEAGAVLGDLVGPVLRPDGRTSSLSTSTAVLRSNYRFGGPLAELAEAVERGDKEMVLHVLGADGGAEAPMDRAPYVQWLDMGTASAGPEGLTAWKRMLAEAATALNAATVHDGPRGALSALARFVTLCAHREGPWGAASWNELAYQWLASQGLVSPMASDEHGAPSGEAPVAQWYPGRPVIVTANDYSLGLFNGDLGVTVRRPRTGGLAVAFQKSEGLALVSPYRLGTVATAYALTVHRAQGSEFDYVAVVLPPAASQVLTRELLYTAVTRARRGLLLMGGAEPVVAALGRPVERASGLAARMWSPG